MLYNTIATTIKTTKKKIRPMIILSVIIRTRYVLINYREWRQRRTHLLRSFQLVVDALHVSLHTTDLIRLIRQRLRRRQRHLLGLLEEHQRILRRIDRLSLRLRHERRVATPT